MKAFDYCLMKTNEDITMKLTTTILATIFILGCSSVPQHVKDDGREAADRAKAKAKEAYRDLEKEM